MATQNVWCLLIDHDRKHDGNYLKVPVENETDIADLKTTVKKLIPGKLNRIDAIELEAWHCKAPRLTTQIKIKLVQEFLDNLDFDDEEKVVELDNPEILVDLGLDRSEVLLIQTPTVRPTVNLEKERDIDQRTSAARLKKSYDEVVGKKGLAPGYTIDQYQTIFDFLAPKSSPYPTNSPPVQIYHPIFEKFTSLVSDPKNKPAEKDRRNVKKLMEALSTIYQNETQYRIAVLQILLGILKLGVQSVGNLSSKADAHTIDGRMIFLLELKYFVGAGCSDSTIQLGHYWIDHSQKLLRDTSCCPTFFLSVTGQWLSLSSTEEEWQILENAKILAALRTCLEKLRAQLPTEISDNHVSRPHTRFFPYPTCYTNIDGCDVEFKYMKPLQTESATCVTFLAEVMSEDERRNIVVKFVSQYGDDVHQYLASKGRAPKLYYFGPLSGGRVDETARRPGAWKMIVMEYIASDTTAPKDAMDQVEEILVDLHSEGYVFGDLRKSNILFDQNGRVLLIDFKWCGRYNMNIQHKGLPDEVAVAIERKRKWTSEDDFGREYAEYPATISQSEDEGVEGVRGCEFILPGHDWTMYKKLRF